PGPPRGPPPRQLDVAVEIVEGGTGVLLVLLEDRSLHEADADPARFGPRLAEQPRAVDPYRAHHHRRGQGRRPPGTGPLLDRKVGEDGRDAGEQERHAVHGRVARELDEPRVRLLAVSEQAPREVAQRVRPQDLARHPGQGREQQPPGAEGADPGRDQEAEDRREQGQGEAQHRHHDDPHPQTEAAVLDDDRGRPVDDAQRRDRAREIAEAEAVRRPGRAGQGDEERRQRDPRHRSAAELREREGEEDSRQESQAVAPEPDQCRPETEGAAANTSSALYEERTKTPAWTVGNPSARALPSSARKPSGLTYCSTGRWARVGRRYCPIVTMSTPAERRSASTAPTSPS